MDDEIKAMLGKLVSAFEVERTDNARFRQEVQARLSGIEATQQRHGERLAAIEARLDEQRQTINAMIPTHIAAVPPPKKPAA